MKRMKMATLGLFLACATVGAYATGNVTFTNTDGTFSSSGVTSGTLSLTSTLTGISGLAPYVADNSSIYPASLGTLMMTTGQMNPGGNIIGSAGTTPTATFAAGGNITFTYTNGVVFTGSFTSATWTNDGSNTWQFNGIVMNGTLTVPGYTPAVIGTAVTISLSDVGSAPSASGSGYSFQDSQGTTNFPAPVLTPVPEPGTLTLLGGGLIGVAVLARRLHSKD